MDVSSQREFFLPLAYQFELINHIMFMFALKIYGSDVLILYLGNIDYDGDLITVFEMFTIHKKCPNLEICNTDWGSKI